MASRPNVHGEAGLDAGESPGAPSRMSAERKRTKGSQLALLALCTLSAWVLVSISGHRVLHPHQGPFHVEHLFARQWHAESAVQRKKEAAAPPAPSPPNLLRGAVAVAVAQAAAAPVPVVPAAAAPAPPRAAEPDSPTPEAPVRREAAPVAPSRAEAEAAAAAVAAAAAAAARPREAAPPAAAPASAAPARALSPGIPYASHAEAARAPLGRMTCGGKVVESELVYWRDVPRDSALPRPASAAEKYLSFEYDAGGWNNIRMGVETVFVYAHATGRTIVLPPPQSLYLIAAQHDSRRSFGLADFLNVTLLAQHRGWRTISMPDYLALRAAEALEAKKQPPAVNVVEGSKLWRYLLTHADALMPGLQHKFFLFDDDAAPGASEGAAHAERKAAFVSGEKRKAILDDLKVRAARHVHSPGSGDHRILTSFYAAAMFKHPRRQAFYRRFIRDAARYRDDIQCAARDVVTAIRERLNTHRGGAFTEYYAIHARRNDFQYRAAKISAGDIVRNLGGNELIPAGALVYLATDDPKGICQGCMWDRKPCDFHPKPRPKSFGCPDDASWDAFARDANWTIVMLGDFLQRPAMAGVNPNYFGMVDQVVCSRAAVFAGTFWSTFTGYIHRLRGYHGLGEQSYYHTPEKLDDLRRSRRNGPGWPREWRAGWTDDALGEVI
ncbi:hypothetical protein M885DRAFT_626810 [Pelagophyceae sp. CCMP2097]|nr:hypothetical protein M885DRAFT_626810 [Pelagophyceae sp. CCMP2097]